VILVHVTAVVLFRVSLHDGDDFVLVVRSHQEVTVRGATLELGHTIG